MATLLSMNRIQGIQSGCSIISFSPIGIKLSIIISKGNFISKK